MPWRLIFGRPISGQIQGPLRARCRGYLDTGLFYVYSQRLFKTAQAHTAGCVNSLIRFQGPRGPPDAVRTVSSLCV